MSKLLLCAAGVAALSLAMQDKAPAWSKGAKVSPAVVGQAPNSSEFAAKVYFAGQPSQADFASYAKLGVKTVINLRTPSELAQLGFDEAAAVKAAGMQYLNVPVGGTPPSDSDFEKIFAALGGAGNSKVLVHCASSNRVGMVWAVFRGSRHGISIEEAISEGKAAGLKNPGLEKIARDRLSR